MMASWPPQRERDSEVDTWGWLLLGTLFLALVVSQCGCGSAWPQRCQTDIRSGVSCDCRPGGIKVVHHTVSGTATFECDGEPLPIHVDERGEP